MYFISHTRHVNHRKTGLHFTLVTYLKSKALTEKSGVCQKERKKKLQDLVSTSVSLLKSYFCGVDSVSSSE